MLSKSQSISVRLSQEDYSYLMKIDRNGAVTQSEKVRELISLARDAVGTESFVRSYMASVETLLPYKAKYKESESRSILIESVFELIEDSIVAIHMANQTEDYNGQLETGLLSNVESFITRMQPLISGESSLEELKIITSKK